MSGHDPNNPENNQPDGRNRGPSLEDKQAALQAWLFNYHRTAGSLGDYYDMYPRDRPIQRER